MRGGAVNTALISATTLRSRGPVVTSTAITHVATLRRRRSTVKSAHDPQAEETYSQGHASGQNERNAWTSEEEVDAQSGAVSQAEEDMAPLDTMYD